MNSRKTISLLLGSLLLIMTGMSYATSIYTQTAQGSYTDNVLNGSRWSTFTSMITGAGNTINTFADFTDSATMSTYGSIWVDQELGNTLSGAEITNLQNWYQSNNAEVLVILDSNWNDNAYISRQDNQIFSQNIADWLADTITDKLVLIGENNSWSSWNDSIMSIVGGSANNECSYSIGSTASSHVLTTGVGTVENVCGSTVIGGAGNPEILFSNNMAAIYNANSTVPEPTTLALLGLGLVGFSMSRRKKVS